HPHLHHLPLPPFPTRRSSDLAFAAQIGGQDALYIMDVERKSIRKKLRLDLNGITNPTWSPDGTRLVFTGLDGGISDLFITDLDRTEEHTSELQSRENLVCRLT